LERLAKALLEFELLDREDIEKIIKGIAIESPKKTRSYVRPQKEKTIAPAPPSPEKNALSKDNVANDVPTAPSSGEPKKETSE
jgi:hypothetical protein